MRSYRAIVTTVFAACLATGHAAAHEGHEDGPKAAPAMNAAPRIEAHSDLFELVGIVERGAMTLYLDRYADNAPVKGARIEIEAGKENGVASANPDGTYTFKSALFGKPASTSFTFTVSAGAESDLLAGDLTLPQAGAAPGHDGVPGVSRIAWAGGVGAALVLVVMLVVLVVRRRGGKGH